MAEPNYVLGTPGAGSTSWSLGGSWSIGGSWRIGGGIKGSAVQWMRSRIGLDAAHQVTKGAGVRIAVLDTGIDLQHPLFAGKLLPGYDFVDNDNDPSEEGMPHTGAYGHGTHVAGLIAQVAPDAKIMPLRILDKDGVGDMWRLARALIYAANPDGDVNTDDGVDIINLSIGTTERASLIEKVLRAETNEGRRPDDPDFPQIRHPGIIVVAAAGNTGDGTRIFPAAASDLVGGMLAVGASTPADNMADFSTRGFWVEFMAPGERIVSSIPGGRYGVWRGTSMAAPIVSGVVALIRSRYPMLAPHDVLERLEWRSEERRVG